VSGYGIRRDHVLLIARDFARHFIRGGAGILFTFTLLITGLSVAAAFLMPVESMGDEKQVRAVAEHYARLHWALSHRPTAQADYDALKADLFDFEMHSRLQSDAEYTRKMRDEAGWKKALESDPKIRERVRREEGTVRRQALERLVDQGGSFIRKFLDLSAADREGVGEAERKDAAAVYEHFVKKQPLPVSATLLMLLFLLPLLVTLGAFNQTSADNRHKGLRYLLLRTERANIFLGRFLGTYLFTAAVLAVLSATVFLYMAFKIDVYPRGEVGLWILQGWVAMVLLALPYVAMCATVSACIDSPFVSLVVVQAIIGVVPLVVWFGQLATAATPDTAAAIGWAHWVMPWPLKFRLLYPDPLMQTLAGAGCVAYAAAYLWIGLRLFQKRDL